MGATEMLRDALFGNPPSPVFKPSREGVLAAFMAQGQELEQLLAVSGIGDTIYETTAAGITGTTNGKLFLVKGDGSPSFADLYKNVSGAAVSQNIGLPSSAFVAALESHIDEVAAASSLGLGEVPVSSTGGEALGGASLTGGGIAIPNGASGDGSYLIQFVGITEGLAARLAGATIEIVSVTPTSADLLSHHPLTNFAARSILANASVVTGGTVVSTEDIGSAIRRVVSLTMTGDERQIGNIVQISGSYSTGARSFDFGTTAVRVVSWPDPDALSVNDRNLALQLTSFRHLVEDEMLLGIPTNQRKIDLNGGGDATGPGLINQASLGATPSNPFELGHRAGTYLLVGLPAFDDVALSSYLGRDRTTFGTFLADNTALATIAASSVVDATSRTRIDGLSLEITNGRYALHSDSGGVITDRTLTISNSRLVHRGNAGAVAYQTSLGGGGKPSRIAVLWSSCATIWDGARLLREP